MSNLQIPSQEKLPRISFEVRKKLIDLVQHKNFSIKKACRKINLNYSTGKLIVKKYRTQGKITKFSYEKPQPSESSEIEVQNVPDNSNKSEVQSLEENPKFSPLASQFDQIVWFWVPTVSNLMETRKMDEYQNWSSLGVEKMGKMNYFQMSF